MKLRLSTCLLSLLLAGPLLQLLGTDPDIMADSRTYLQIYFGGAVFLMLADLVARTLLNPLELPIGVVTSFVGAIVFVVIFYQSRKER